MTHWHRILGLLLKDLLLNTPFEVELEKELSNYKQFLDIVIIRKKPGILTEPLPDGFDNLGAHSLITYKSMRETLDDWTLKELIGHYVNYRKQLNPKQLVAEDQFRLYAISTRFPEKLSQRLTLIQVQSGIYDIQWGTDLIRIIVLNQIAQQPQNALWGMLSGDLKLIQWGKQHYQGHDERINHVMQQIFEHYNLEGLAMPYTLDDFERDYLRSHVHLLPPEDRLKGLRPADLLKRLKPEERLEGMHSEDIIRNLDAQELIRLQELLAAHKKQ